MVVANDAWRAVGARGLVLRFRPCAVILDLGLPYRPGTSLLSELKSDPETASVPVVVIRVATLQTSDPGHTHYGIRCL